MFDFNASLNDVAPASPMLLPDEKKRNGKSDLFDGCLLCVFFHSSSPLRYSLVSVVFDFNASLNDVAPASPKSFAGDVMKQEKSELLMDVFVCLCLLSSQHRSSFVSDAFDFSDSLNDFTPASPIWLSVQM